MLASFFLGFAIWQFADVAGFHWLLGLHRIRVDVPNPLAYDVGWLVVVGLPPLGLAWFADRYVGGPPRRGGHSQACALTIAVLTIGAGSLASLGSAGDLNRIVVFRSGTGPAAALAAIAAIDGRVVWTDASGEVVAFQGSRKVTSLNLFRFGALFVGPSAMVSGCITRTQI